jgi:chorismate mutase
MFRIEGHGDHLMLLLGSNMRRIQCILATAVIIIYNSRSTSFVLAFWGPLATASTSPRHRTTHCNGSTSTTSSTFQALDENITCNGSVEKDENCVKTVDVLSLNSIRSTLIRQEETIIFALIERAQFRQNDIVYRKDGFGSLGIPVGSTDPNTDEPLSFMEYMLVGTEALHCGARRYKSPEEHAFFPERLPDGPIKALPDLQYSQELLSSENGAANVNFNKRLLQIYISQVVPAVCRPGDDEQHGSTVLCDIAVLQALSRRVHYGKFVAESKYRSDPISYQKLVDANDADGVMALLTDLVVEEKVLRRARLKAATYGSEPLLSELPPIEGSDATSTLVATAAASAVVAALSALNMVESAHRDSKVDPSVIEQVYRDIIIPMTKDIEVAYLFLRCGKEPPPEYRQ